MSRYGDVRKDYRDFLAKLMSRLQDEKDIFDVDDYRAVVRHAEEVKNVLTLDEQVVLEAFKQGYKCAQLQAEITICRATDDHDGDVEKILAEVEAELQQDPT